MTATASETAWAAPAAELLLTVSATASVVSSDAAPLGSVKVASVTAAADALKAPARGTPSRRTVAEPDAKTSQTALELVAFSVTGKL